MNHTFEKVVELSFTISFGHAAAQGEDLIVADGTTLLGAGDKADIAESGRQVEGEWL
jgi:hypothetical protein